MLTRSDLNRPGAKTVSGIHSKTKEPFTETYDRLLIATGASPVTLDLDSHSLEGVHVLKTIPHALSILDNLKKTSHISRSSAEDISA